MKNIKEDHENELSTKLKSLETQKNDEVIMNNLRFNL